MNEVALAYDRTHYLAERMPLWRLRLKICFRRRFQSTEVDRISFFALKTALRERTRDTSPHWH